MLALGAPETCKADIKSTQIVPDSHFKTIELHEKDRQNIATILVFAWSRANAIDKIHRSFSKGIN